MANELGLRNVCFELADLRATVDGLAADGYGLVGGIQDNDPFGPADVGRAMGLGDWSATDDPTAAAAGMSRILRQLP